MIEFTPHPVRLPTGPSGTSQTPSQEAGTAGFAAILADAADPGAKAPPGDAPQPEAAIVATLHVSLPVPGNILPGAQSALAVELAPDIVPAPQPTQVIRPTRARAATAEPTEAPAMAGEPKAAGEDEAAPSVDTALGLLTPIFSALMAQPGAMPLPEGAEATPPAVPIPAQIVAQPVTAVVATSTAEANAATAAVQAHAEAVISGKSARAAAVDPRVFGLKLERETGAAQPAAQATDQIIGQRDKLSLASSAFGNAQAAALTAAASEEARPRSSAGALSALALADKSAPEQDNAAPFAPSLPLTGPLITDNSAPAAARSAAPTSERIDFAALVDSVARARDAAAGTQDVAVSVTHAEFGKVSLRFQNEDNGLSVSLASPDPGFAPAVAAARLADTGFGQSSQGSGQQSQGQTSAAQSASSQSGLAGDGATSARGGSSQRQDAQQQGRNQTNRGDGPRPSAATGDDLRRGAIWA